MMQLMWQGGFVMWPILLGAVLVVGLFVWAVVRTGRLAGPNALVEAGIDAVLFWGVWAAVVGLLGTFLGIYQAAGAIERAGAINPAIIWGGIKVSLTTTVFGLVVFSVAALLWMGLRVRYRRRITTVS